MNNLFPNLDFHNIINTPNFKEDSVREVIILPILKALGYQDNNIIRSKTLESALAQPQITFDGQLLHPEIYHPSWSQEFLDFH